MTHSDYYATNWNYGTSGVASTGARGRVLPPPLTAKNVLKIGKKEGEIQEKLNGKERKIGKKRQNKNKQTNKKQKREGSFTLPLLTAVGLATLLYGT